MRLIVSGRIDDAKGVEYIGAMFASSLGKKYIMAVTGVMLMVFVAGHLVGNLQIFLGADWLNSYAKHLMEWPLLLWPARLILGAALLVHMVTGIRLAIENRKARPVAYDAKATIQAPITSRTMAVSGLAVFFFILFHLSHFTLGRVHPEYFHLTDPQGRHDVYSMVILSFRHGWTALFYLIAIFLLSMHLSHGLASFFQTLGLSDEKRRPCFERAGLLFGVFIFIGYSSIAVASFTGWLKPLTGGV